MPPLIANGQETVWETSSRPVPQGRLATLDAWVPSCGDRGFCEMITWRTTAVLFLFGIV